MSALVCPMGLVSFTLNTCFLNILIVSWFFPVTLRLESCLIIYRSSDLSAILRRGGVGRYEEERSEARSQSGNTYIPLCILAWGWAGRQAGVDGPAKALTLVWRGVFSPVMQGPEGHWNSFFLQVCLESQPQL